MIEIGLLAVVCLIGICLLPLGIGILFAFKRASKKGVAAGVAAVTLLTAAEQRLRHKDLTDGELFDHAKAVGDVLVKRGKMTTDKWQPIFEQIATSLTHPDAPPEAPKESEAAT